MPRKNLKAAVTEKDVENAYVPMEYYHTWPSAITEGWEEAAG